MNFKPVLALVAAACVGFGVFAAEPKSFPAYVNAPSGGAYLATTVYPDRSTVVEIDHQTSDEAKDKPLFGVRNAGFNFGIWLGTKAGYSYNPYWGNSGNIGAKTVYHPYGYSAGVRHLVRLSKDGLTVDGQTLYAASSFAGYDRTSRSTVPLTLLSLTSDSYKRYYVGKVYRMTVWDGGEIVHNYVPCIDANDVACFYDTVAKACVYSSTTTAFTAPTETTEGDYRFQGSALQVRVKAIADLAAGRVSIDGGTPAATAEKWVAPGTEVTLAATSTDETSALFRRWPERIPTDTPTNATVTVTADYAIVVTNRVFARVNDFIVQAGGDRNINRNTDWRSGKYPEIDLPEKTEAAWVRTGDILFLTNDVDSVSWTYVTQDNTSEGTTMRQGGTYAVGWKLGTVVGDVYHNLGGIVADCYRLFVIDDASRFQGYVRNNLGTVRAGWHGPLLHVRPGWTNELPQFYTMGLSYLVTMSEGAGGYARAHRLFGRGLFMVGHRWSNQYGAAGSHFILDHLEEGPEGQMFVGYDAPMEIRGKLWDEPEIASGAALHLDASLSETRVISPSGQVTYWRDVDNSSLFGTKIGTGAIRLGTSTNGLDVMCCSNAAFKLTKTLQARELFVVFRDLTAYNVAPPYLVGNSTGVTAWERSTEAGRLFRRSQDTSGRTKELDAGEVWLDGTRVEVDAYENFSHAIHVVGGGLASGSSDIGFIGSKTETSEVGNIELAEVLVYETSLTPRERQQTCDALRKKWQWKTKSRDWDLGSVVVESTTGGSGEMTFTEGRTAFRELKYPSANATFTKKGDGRLEVGRLVPDGRNVTVAGGRFALTGPSAPVKAEMAPGPTVWLDASQAKTLVTDPNNPTLVCRWNDPRGQNDYGQTIYATNFAYNAEGTGRYGRSPKKVYDTPTGLTALDLGTTHSHSNWVNNLMGDAGILQISNVRFQEGFLVTRHTGSSFPIMTNGGWEFFGGNESLFLASSYCCGSFIGGYWTINGETYRSDSAPTTAGTYYVIGFKSLTRSDYLKYLGMGRNNCDGGGGTTYGEIIYYDRILTDEERRNTEAYLMKKWLGKDHPAATAETPAVATMTFEDGVENVIEADCALTVTNLVTTSDTVEKTGSGDVTIELIDTLTVSNITVSAGSLTANLKAAGDYLADTAYTRFDSSNPKTLTTYEENGTTFVTQVTHPLGVSSAYDTAVRANDSSHPMTRTNDMFLTSVELGGRTREVFDFGDYQVATNPSVVWTSETTAVTNITIGVTGNSAFMSTEWNTITEAYVVMRETPEAKAGKNPIIPCWPYTFDRSDTTWICGWHCLAVRKSETEGNWPYWMDLDGQTIGRENEYPEGWHVFSYSGGGGSITVPRTWGGCPVWGHFASGGETWMQLGGQQIAEYIGFDRSKVATNAPAVRLAIRDYLRSKWFGVGTARTLGKLTVAEGATATIALRGGGVLAVNEIAGGGTFALSLADLAALTVDIRGKRDVAKMTVLGAVEFADEGTVKLNFVDPTVHVAAGLYPILTATSLGDIDLTKWSLSPRRQNNCNFVLQKSGDTLYLGAVRGGLSICVR